MPAVDVIVGKSTWTLNVRAEDRLALPRPDPAPITDVRAAVVAALEQPLRFEAFKRALTPDDRIALVVDESLPKLPELIAGVLEYLASAGIPPSAVTAVSPAGAFQPWVHELPDAMADLQTEIHQPDDRKKLSYLAATKEGHRIYLNRTLVDADQSIVLTGRGFDTLLGYSGGSAAIYPGLADADSMRSLVPQLSPQTLPDGAWRGMKEASEVAWLLGSPFYIQVIAGDGDEIAQVFSGLGETLADGVVREDARWKSSIAEPADTVIVTLSGDNERHDFAALARAALCGARAAKPGGTVIVLSEAEPELGPATDVLRRCDDPPEAVRLLFREKPIDAQAAVNWCWAAERTKLYVVSEIRPTTVEEMFATPISSPKDVQRLLDSPGKIAIIPDGHKSWVTVDSQ